jgi:hypothetical protein
MGIEGFNPILATKGDASVCSILQMRKVNAFLPELGKEPRRLRRGSYLVNYQKPAGQEPGPQYSLTQVAQHA